MQMLHYLYIRDLGIFGCSVATVELTEWRGRAVCESLRLWSSNWKKISRTFKHQCSNTLRGTELCGCTASSLETVGLEELTWRQPCLRHRTVRHASVTVHTVCVLQVHGKQKSCQAWDSIPQATRAHKSVKKGNPHNNS